MEDKNRPIDEIRENPKKGSGMMLAAARKQQNRSVEEIADELNLSVTQIRTIEIDQSEGLPEPTYVRGYIRSYAKLLGLDPNRVLDNYLNPNWQKGSRLDEMPRGIGSATDSDSPRFFSPAKVVVMLLLASLVGFLWLTGKLDGLFSSQQTEVTPASSNAIQTTGRATAQVTTQVSPSDNSAADQASPVPTLPATGDSNTSAESDLNTAQLLGDAETSDGIDPTAAPTSPSTVNQSQTTTDPSAEIAVESASVETEQTNAEVAKAHELVLSFSDTCWVDIRDGDGKRLAYKTYAEGETLDISSDIRVNVFLGNAKVVSATYNGQAYDLSPYREGVFARFSLGE